MADATKTTGMGGSNGGKNRYEGTETLKKRSTKRRRNAMREAMASIGLAPFKGVVSGRTYYE